MVFTPVLIVLVCFIAAIVLITGVHMVERCVVRIGQALEPGRSGGEADV